jgi:hypothetical protein
MVIARAVHAGVVNVVCVCTHHCLMIAHDRRVCAHYCITHLPHPRYEKARRLCKKIPEIRKKYLKDLDDSDALVRAVCSCVWAYVIPNPPRHDSVRLLCGSSIAWHCASATRRARTRCARACTRACTNSYTAPPPTTQADTVGCCSLRVEHVKLVPPSSVHLSFLGKVSV